MARQPKVTQENVEVNKASSTDDISRFRLGEIGSIGLPIFNGVSNAEMTKELNPPNNIKTYRLMSLHPAINAPLSLFSNMVSKAKYRFVPPKDATEEEKKRTEIVASMFDDMEHPIEDFIEEAMTFTQYGWSVCEKVFRKRTKSSGSMYDDGLIGIRKLSLRSQESIEKFIFDETGNEVIAVKQNLSGLNDPYNQFYRRKELEIVIPRSKFMLFNLGRNRSNPYGTSPLRDAYLPWRYLQALEELEAQSVCKDINGIPVLSVPAQFLSADSSPEQQKAAEYFRNMLRNLQQGSQSAVMLPSTVDETSRTKLFELQLLSQDGKKNHDITKIKEYYKSLIFTAMGADLLLLGQSGNAGSFSLGTLKNTQTSNVAESFVRRIVQVINQDLIKQIFEINGWPVDRRCKMDYEGFEGDSLDELGKYLQRVASVNLITKDLDVVNFARSNLGIDPLPEGTDLSELLPENTSRAGEGGATPFEGTRTSMGDGSNSSDLNSDNAS